MSRPADLNHPFVLHMSQKKQTTELTQASNQHVKAMDRNWRTAELVSEHVRGQCPIMVRAKKNNPSAPANLCSMFAAPCVSRRGSDGNVQLIQPRRPTPCKTKLKIPRFAFVAAAVVRMCPRRAVSRASAMNLSPRSRAHPPRSRQPLSTLAWKNRCLPCNRSLMKSPSSLFFGGVAPNRRNHGARGLLISACVSLRHMARIRPATVAAQSLASSGRKSQSTRSFKTSSNASVMVDWQSVSFGHNARRSRSRSACLTMRFCACLRSAQFSIHVGIVM